MSTNLETADLEAERRKVQHAWAGLQQNIIFQQMMQRIAEKHRVLPDLSIRRGVSQETRDVNAGAYEELTWIMGLPAMIQTRMINDIARADNKRVAKEQGGADGKDGLQDDGDGRERARVASPWGTGRRRDSGKF